MKIIVLALISTAVAAERVSLSLNPIRKVVTMLQGMSKKVEAEGEKEKDLFEKYMCYCKNSGGELKRGISAAEKKIPEVGSDIKRAESDNAQLKLDLKQAQTDRSAAKTAIADATAIREKEAAAFASLKAESDANIAAMAKATAAIEKGMQGSFVQTNAAQLVKQLAVASQDMLDDDREVLISFLSGKADYAPASGQITGILKQMQETMEKALADATSTETGAIANFDELVSAKTKEVDALTSAIEDKTKRSGELAVEIVEMKNDLSDTEESLLEDQKFLADMEKNCATKEKEWAEVCKTRSEELVALADTIKILNDDDALELFKKTLPGASSSFLQVQVTAASMKARATAILRAARSRSTTPQLDLVMLALRGKAVNFDKVLKMIDEMVALLKEEQVSDDSKKEFCEKQIDTLEDKKKSLDHTIGNLEKKIADLKEGIATFESEIKALGDGIKALDKAVAEATAQRKEEHKDYTDLMAADSAAKELLGFAKNRLNKFYNPKLYKAPPAREMTAMDRANIAAGGTLAPTAAPGGIANTGVTVFAQIKAHLDDEVAPPPPPEAVGAYSKKSEESNGVIGMIDLLVADLDKEMTEAETSEKDAQADYETSMKDSAEKRVQDTKNLEDREGAKAQAEVDLQNAKAEKTTNTKELLATLEVTQATHGECDWLLQNFEVRKEARAGEVDSLTKAKAVLSGANFSD